MRILNLLHRARSTKTASAVIIPALLTALTMLSACDDLPVSLDPIPPLAIEAWIESGEAPVVIVTHPVDLTTDSASFDGFVEKWCRVSIFDGDRRTLLTGKINSSYLPSFIFTTSRLKGIAGHTYRLLVETETDTIESTVTMPTRAPRISRLEARQRPDSLYTIQAWADDIDPDGYYKFYLQTIPGEGRYYPAYSATFRGSDYNPDLGMNLVKGVRAVSESDDFSHYFKSGDQVKVKLCAITTDIYEFWKVYEANVTIGSNLFFSMAQNCPGNIPGAAGYFSAAPTARAALRIP